MERAPRLLAASEKTYQGYSIISYTITNHELEVLYPSAIILQQIAAEGLQGTGDDDDERAMLAAGAAADEAGGASTPTRALKRRPQRRSSSTPPANVSTS